MVGVNSKTRHGGASHSIVPSGYDRRSTQLISEVNAAVKQCHAVPITITIWPIPFVELRWDNIHGLKFRHWRETTAPTGLVGVCCKQIFQPRTVGAGECATLAKSKAHTKSRKSTVGGNLCSKLSSGGDDLDQSIVGIDDLVRFLHSHAAKIKSTSQNHDAACDPKRKSQPTMILKVHLLWIPKVCLMHWTMMYHRMTENPLWKCQSLKSLCAEQCVDLDGVRTNRNAADAMTKFKGAHSEPLFTLLRTGMYTLKGEKTELADRSQIRDGTIFFLFICHRIEEISFWCT